MFRRRSFAPARVDLQMTPLIDVVFQLLTFFLMSFRIAAAEGDINLLLPRSIVEPGPANRAADVIRVRLTARDDGNLASLEIMGRPPLAGPRAFAELRASAVHIAGAARHANRDDPIVELAVDDHLRYEYVVAAVAAVSGQVDDRGTIAPLLRKVTLVKK